MKLLTVFQRLRQLCIGSLVRKSCADSEQFTHQVDEIQFHVVQVTTKKFNSLTPGVVS